MATVINFIDTSNTDLLNKQHNLILVSVEQSPPGGDYAQLVPTATLLGKNPIITFDNDQLNLSSSHQKLIIYGDVQNLILEAQGSDHQADTYTAFYHSLNDYVITTGNDQITTGSGKDLIYGDFYDINMTAHSGVGVGAGVFFDGADTEALIIGNKIIMGNDKIDAGNGNNIIWGDAHNITGASIGNNGYYGGVAEADVSNNFFMGNDKISAGKGNNVIYADVQDMTFTQEGGQGVDAGITVINQVGGFNFGSDQVTVGNGKNTIYGDSRNISMTMNGGDAIGTGSLAYSETAFSFTFGDDKVTVGNGGNVIYGDIASFTLSTEPGVLNGVPFLFFMEVYYQVGFGDDTLLGGSGNDVIYGDLSSFSLDITGLDSTFANVRLGNDFLIGGAGNDVLYGDLPNPNQFNIVVDPPNFVSFTGGNDTFQGGTGKNTLFGGIGIDTVDYSNATGAITVNLNNAVQNMTSIGLGKDTLNSIEGVIGSRFNDTLIGDNNNNVLTGGRGNDSLNGNDGIDTAVFTGKISEYNFTFSGQTITAVSDTVSGRDGTDTLSHMEKLQFNSIAYNPIVGTNGNDILLATSEPDLVLGRNGTDTVSYVNSTIPVVAMLQNPNLHGIYLEVYQTGSFTEVPPNFTSFPLIQTAVTDHFGADVITTPETVTARFTANLQIATTGTYNFFLISDDEGMLLIDGQLVTIADWFSDEQQGSINLSAGAHTLEVLWTAGRGFNDITVSWDGPGFSKEILNADDLTLTNSATAVGDVYQNVENLTGSNYSDQLFGNSNNNVLTGLGGDDTLTGGLGTDTFAISMTNDAGELAILNADDDVIVDLLLGQNDRISFSGVFDTNNDNVINVADLDEGTTFQSASLGGSADPDTLVLFSGGGTLACYDITFTSFTNLQTMSGGDAVFIV